MPAREEQALEQTRDEGGDQDAREQRPASVFFLHGRAYHQQQHHVARKVGIAAVAQHMAEKAEEKEGGQRSPVNRKEGGGAVSSGEDAHEQRAQGEKEIGQDDWGVVMDPSHLDTSGA